MTEEEMKERIEELEDQVSDLDEALVKAEVDQIKMDHYRNKLEEAADLMALYGLIHNTPHAKREWIEGP